MSGHRFSTLDRPGDRPAILTTQGADFDVANLHSEGRQLSRGDQFRAFTIPNDGVIDFDSQNDVYRSDNEIDFSVGVSNDWQTSSRRFLDMGNQAHLYSQNLLSDRDSAVDPNASAPRLCGCSVCMSASDQNSNGYARTRNQEKFDAWDLNDSGSLSRAEIAHGAVNKMLTMDRNDDGVLDLDEVRAGARANGGNECLATLGFRLADRNWDGELDYSEMQRVGRSVSRVAMYLGDCDRDGQLSYREFSRLAGPDGPATPRPDPKPEPWPEPQPEPRPEPKPEPEPPDNPDKPPDGDTPPVGTDGVPLATEQEIKEAMKHVENRGASEAYIREIEDAMREMPQEFVQALINGRTTIVAYPPRGDGLGGSYNSGTNQITMYENGPFSTKTVLACEMGHNWDLNPYIGEHVTSQQWFRDAYQQAQASGISQGDNSYNNVYEFIHHMAKYYSGITGGNVGALMDYLGADYQRRTREALS